MCNFYDRNGGGDVAVPGKPDIVNEFLQRKQEALNNKLRVKHDLGMNARPVDGVAAALQPFAAHYAAPYHGKPSTSHDDAGVDDYMHRLQRIRKQNMQRNPFPNRAGPNPAKQVIFLLCMHYI